MKNPGHRPTKSASTLLPSLMATPKVSSPPSEPKSLPWDEVGRSFPEERLDFEEYGHCLHATTMAGISDGEGGFTADEIETASSCHRATVVPVGGNVALRQQLVSSPGTDLASPMYTKRGPSSGAVMVTTATVIPGRRSCETSESPADTPSLKYTLSPTKPLNFSSPTIDLPTLIKSPTPLVERLHGLGISGTDWGNTVRDDSSILPFSLSKQTVRLVKNVDGNTLSPDSVSSGIHKKPTIAVQDMSDAPSDIPMYVVPSGKSFAFHPILPLGSSSGRSTPMSTASGSSTRSGG